MMDEVFDLTCCSSSFVPKSTLLHKPIIAYQWFLSSIERAGLKSASFEIW